MITSILRGSEQLQQRKEALKEPRNVVVFDLMDEYRTLLIDSIFEPNWNVRLICVGEKSLPGPTYDYMRKPLNERDERALDDATNALFRTMLFPKSLKDRKDEFKPLVKALLKRNKICFANMYAGVTVQDFLDDNKEFFFQEKMGPDSRTAIEVAIETILVPHEHEIITATLATHMADELEAIVEETTVHTAKKYIAYIVRLLRKFAKPDNNIPPHLLVDVSTLASELNNDEKTNLFIVSSHDPDEMRIFARMFGYRLYESRRRNGIINPMVCLVFDEADEFIPSSADKTTTQGQSKRMIEQMARRGRKFGLGVGIATQRIAYMDTNIMGQLHTYYISKLPRKYDRDTVGEAFSLSEEAFKQTFKFNKGDWLLVSHEATGLEAIPIPIHTTNAEERIRSFLNTGAPQAHKNN